MDLLRELKINAILKDLLFKYLVHNKALDNWAEENEVPVMSIQLIGYTYHYDPYKHIDVILLYEDDCADNGIGLEELSVDFDDFKTYMKEYEQQIENALK